MAPHKPFKAAGAKAPAVRSSRVPADAPVPLPPEPDPPPEPPKPRPIPLPPEPDPEPPKFIEFPKMVNGVIVANSAEEKAVRAGTADLDVVHSAQGDVSTVRSK